jgi:hypothetical protein
MGVLAKRFSIIQAWISGIKLGSNSARQVIKDVSQVLPLLLMRSFPGIPSGAIGAKPKAAASEIMPWPAGQVEAMADELPDCLSIIPYFGAACALRQGEVFALASDDLDSLRRNVHVEVQIRCLNRRDTGVRAD